VAARALETAIGKIAWERPFNFAVLPTPDGKLLVYAYPARSKSGTAPLGADTRWTLSSDGSKVLEERFMHKAILEVPLKKDAEITLHSHVLTDEVEDTDVALAVVMNVPTFVTMKSGAMFGIDGGGNIQLVLRPGDKKPLPIQQFPLK
jgi:hypothetical protein